MANKVCYCRQDIMSRCVAENYGQECVCGFFEKATEELRCMFKVENLDNHCSSYLAQGYSREHGVVHLEDVEIGEEYNIDDMLEEPFERRTCHGCLLFTCSNLVKIAADRADTGGITAQDLWDIGSNCSEYTKEG